MGAIDLDRELSEYMAACYPGHVLPGRQIREVEQAFLSGMHALNEIVALQGNGYGPSWLRDAIRVKLMAMGCFRPVSVPSG